MTKHREKIIHIILLLLLIPTLFPLFVTVVNSFREDYEFNHSIIGVPDSIERFWNKDIESNIPAEQGFIKTLFSGYIEAFHILRPLLRNTIVICTLSSALILFLGSLTAYCIVRYRFPFRQTISYIFVATFMFPGVLTLIPGFLLIKELDLLNSYWAILLPYTATGQALAIYIFQSYFKSIPQDLFDSAQVEGAGFWQIYRHIVLPSSRPILSVIFINTFLTQWNNFLWPFIVNNDEKYHMLASGLYSFILSSNHANIENSSTISAAYTIASIPLLLLLLLATKEFINGMVGAEVET